LKLHAAAAREEDALRAGAKRGELEAFKFRDHREIKEIPMSSMLSQLVKMGWDATRLGAHFTCFTGALLAQKYRY
jgi:hypothetical protein